LQLRLAIKDTGIWHHEAIAGTAPALPRQLRFLCRPPAGPPGALLLSSYASTQKADPPRTFVETSQPINP